MIHGGRRVVRHCGVGGLLCLTFVSVRALAWGDEGHEIVGRIADRYLEPLVRTRIDVLLAGDKSKLTPRTDIAIEATWADKFRDSDRDSRRPVHYNGTRNWHYVDLELDSPDLVSACFGKPAVPTGAPASSGPASDCIVDKIGEFAAELRNPRTPKKEQRLALQFLLHLVGDVHQPLHASDAHDEGGNRKTATGPGLHAATLHSQWDTAFVARLGTDDQTVAQQLITKITPANRTQWAAGTPAEWAHESFLLAKDHAYGLLPAPTSADHYTLTAEYEHDAAEVVAVQLSKAGVRLAYLLNQALK